MCFGQAEQCGVITQAKASCSQVKCFGAPQCGSRVDVQPLPERDGDTRDSVGEVKQQGVWGWLIYAYHYDNSCKDPSHGSCIS